MKKILLLLIVVLSGTTISAQKPSLTVRAGYNVHTGIGDWSVNFRGLSLDFFIPTKDNSVNWIIGTTYLGINNTSFEEQLNGWGFYGGINAQWWNILTVELCAGFYPVKYDYDYSGTNFSAYSSSLGGSASLGVRFGWQSVYFNPQVSLLYAGGDARFLFWGVKLPLTIVF